MNELNVYYFEGGDNKQPLRLGASKARFFLEIARFSVYPYG